jgi:putative aldouronate transport system permease protein
MIGVLTGGAAMKIKHGKIRKIKKYIPFYVMLIPGIIYLIINNYMPIH